MHDKIFFFDVFASVFVAVLIINFTIPVSKSPVFSEFILRLKHVCFSAFEKESGKMFEVTNLK